MSNAARKLFVSRGFVRSSSRDRNSNREHACNESSPRLAGEMMAGIRVDIKIDNQLQMFAAAVRRKRLD